MDHCDEVKAMWEGYIETLPEGTDAAIYMTWHFADDQAAADELGQLARTGAKTATAGLLWEYETNEEELPRPGDLSIITDWDGAPLCIIRTTRVDVRPFNEVDADHAAHEGEGDRSLASWREVHWRVFAETCATLGRAPAEDMPVVCERFQAVYPPPSGQE
ncbi:MAG TPA: ASCH domain-containing protein [Anaerolineae bacterium]